MNQKTKTSNIHAGNEIVEIFYDEDGKEVWPFDSDYEKYIAKKEYFGSFFINSKGEVIRKANLSRREELRERELERDLKRKKKEEKEARKLTPKQIVLFILLFFVMLAITLLWDKVIWPFIGCILLFLAILGSRGIRS